jgi:peptide/nickel transport system permease protein
MAQKVIESQENSAQLPRVSQFKVFKRIFFRRGIVVAGLVIIILLVIIAIFAPLIAPYNPDQQDLLHPLQKSSKVHLLGTDSIGRDTLSRILFGTRISLLIGIVSVGIAAFIGMTLGTIAGYFGRWINAVIMRFIDALMSFPMILLALLIAALLSSGLKNVMIAIGIGLMPSYARLMCAQTLAVREQDYILAARAAGVNNISIMVKHIVPNCFPPLIVMVTMQLGSAILAEAGLSYLGIGVDPKNPAWGAMVSDGYQYLLKVPILSFAPGIAIMLVVFAFNMVGDGLRDALDPRLRAVL